VLRELAGDAALRGPAGPDGRPLRLHYHHFELSRREFESWCAGVAARAGGGYDVAAFGVGRAPGDSGSKAAAAAAVSAGGEGAATAAAAAAVKLDAGGFSGGPAAQLAEEALTWGEAVGGAPGAAQDALPGAGHALHAAVWVRREEEGQPAPAGAAGSGSGGAPPPAAAVPVPLRCFWQAPCVVARAAPKPDAEAGGSTVVAVPEAMEQI
jgi:hypothetical protein